MRIALLGPANPYRGGLAAFNERLAVELSHEHEVTIFTFTLQYPDFLFPGKTQYTTAPPPPGPTIVRTLSSVNPLTWVATGRRIKQERFDLLIIGFWLPFLGPAFGTVARVAGIPTVGIVHNIVPHESRVGDRALARYFVGGCDAFVALTGTVRDDLSTFLRRQPSVVSPHPIYDHFGPAPADSPKSRENLGLTSHGEYVLFFGLVRAYKGVDLLLEAMADERIKARGTRLIVAGEFYEDRAAYDALVAEHCLENSVIIHDRFIPDDEVGNYFQSVDLLVQPYRNATQSGVTPIAYHFELPMVVTNVGGLPAMCPDGVVGYVVEPTPKSLADGIIRYLAETDRGAMRKNLAREKERYSWSRFAEVVLSVLPSPS